MRRIYVTALFFTLTASAVHGQAPRASPSEAVAVLRANRSPADLTDTPLFVPEQPEPPLKSEAIGKPDLFRVGHDTERSDSWAHAEVRASRTPRR
jgi:hypothetical protein